jgi:hypothetical protein
MKLRPARACALAGAAVAAAVVSTARPSGQQPPAPTFTRDVAPILYKNCASCHRPGEIAPMSLLTFEDARPYARAIRAKVSSGEMPPWHADAPPGTFVNDRRLSAAEKSLLVRWVDAGAPRGDEGDLPRAPVFADGWNIGTPDVVVAMPAAYEVPASGTVEYQYFEAPTNFAADKWVQAIEVRPGARSVVHHVLVFAREPDGTAPRPPYVQVVPKPAPPREAGRGERPASGAPRNLGALIATMAPGTDGLTFPPGTAMKIKAGSVLTFQVHYTTTGTPTPDRSSVGIVFAKNPPAQEIRSGAFMNTQLTLPPGAADEAVDAAVEFRDDVHIRALFPHTHLRGKSWSYRLVYPDGRVQPVLSVPRYDFNWQTYYVFAAPLAVPKGARLEATAHYDNSAANRSNPDPTKEVHWGDQTWEEMQYSGITYSVDQLVVSR